MNGGYGDVKSIASTTFQDGGLTILDGTCAMHRQATFYASQFPEGTTVAEDGDVYAFYLPSARSRRRSRSSAAASSSPPTRIAPEVVAAQEWLSTADYANSLGKNSTGIASANLNADPALYTGLTRIVVETLQDPNSPVPVRWLGPHAGRRGRRVVLDRDDGLDHGQVDAGDAGLHRVQLADLLMVI